MKLSENMKVFDSNGRTGIIKSINGNDLRVEIEQVITISYNAHQEKATQTSYQIKRFRSKDLGTKLFFSPDDRFLSYEERANKPEYKEYLSIILEEKDQREKLDIEKIKQTVGNLPVLTDDMLQSKQQEYIDKEKSTIDENSYLQNLQQLGIRRDEPYFARMDLKLEYEDMPFYEKIYIGKSSVYQQGHYFVHDWRAPVCSRYYLKNETSFEHRDDFYGWVFHYDLLLRRAIKFNGPDLAGFENEYVYGDVNYDGITDPFLMDVLTEKSTSGKLTDIIKTIQSNQNNIIRSNIKDNLIVQGCAGSGKTMILLHRLSYLLFNNKGLNVNAIRILSPNTIFDEHINELAKELELDKIQKGTIEEYYEEKLKVYGLIDAEYRISVDHGGIQDKFDFFYTETFQKMLRDAFEKWNIAFTEDKDYVTNLAKSFHITISESKSVKNELSNYGDVIKSILDKSRRAKKDLLFEYIKMLPDFPKLSPQNQNALNHMIASNSIGKNKNQQLMQLLGENDLSEIEIQNKVARTRIILSRMAKFCFDDESFSIKKAQHFIEEELKSVAEQGIKWINSHRIRLNKAYAYFVCYWEKQTPGLLTEADRKEFDQYLKWPQLEAKVISPKVIEKLEIIYEALPTDMDFIKKQIYTPIRTALFKEKNITINQMKYYKNDLVALLYLAHLYAGPLRKKDNLLNIDEGQDISPMEYELLNHMNGNEAVFNIYGDTQQLIKEDRGISDWKQLTIKPFQFYVLNENYRNTIQITNFCNDTFGYHTTPVGLDGRDVMEIDQSIDLNHVIAEFLLEDGIRKAIIVKDTHMIPNIFAPNRMQDLQKFNYVVSNGNHIKQDKMNVFTVQMAKGLEFDNVLVIDKDMSQNELYIALTRALSFLTCYHVAS